MEKIPVQPEVAGVTFSDTDSAPVSNFESGSAYFSNLRIRLLLQIPATIIILTVIYPCSYLRNDHTDSCQCRNGKVTPDPGPVSQIFDSGSESERKTQNPAGVDSGNPDAVPNLAQACNKNNDEWTQRTTLSTIYKTKIYSETFRWYCSTHPKCEINDADQHKREREDFFTSQHMEIDK